MTDMAIEKWGLLYLGAAAVFALAIAMYTSRRWSDDRPAAASRAGLIALGGAVWPVIAVGLGQLAVIGVIARRMRH